MRLGESLSKEGTSKVRLSIYIPRGRKKDPATLLNLLTLELGSVAHGIHYASIREGTEANAYLAEARLGLCDLVTTCQLLAEVENWDWYEVCTDGLERFKERMEDARKRLASKNS